MTLRSGAPDRPEDHLPLTTVAFEILLSLSGGELHGYAVMRAVEERTGGASVLHAGTLYRALARFVESGLLEELEERPAPESDERRRYYRLTSLGRQVAAAEARRLESQVGAARAHGLLGGH
jgi:DNA-binding PadR family transcriptional regulator